MQRTSVLHPIKLSVTLHGSESHRRSRPGNVSAFWKGYVDGDGNLGINKHPAYPEIGCPIVQIVGSAAIVSQFADYVRSVVPTSTVKGTILKRCPSVSTLSVTAWSAVAVARALYSGATIYLDRKMVLAERVMRWSEGRRKGSPVAGGR